MELAVPKPRKKKADPEPGDTDGLCGVSFCTEEPFCRVRCSEMRFPTHLKGTHKLLMLATGDVQMCVRHAGETRGELERITGRRD